MICGGLPFTDLVALTVNHRPKKCPESIYTYVIARCFEMNAKAR